MVRLTLFCLLFAFGINSSYSQISSVKVNSSSLPLGQNGIYYSLPRAVLKVDVVITRTDFVPGPYANFANQILGLTDFISQAETEYALKGINVGSFVESDPKAVFFLNLGERSSKSDRSFIVQLQSNGVLKGMNETTARSENNRIENIELQADFFAQDFNYFADLIQLQKMDTIIQRIVVDTSTVEDIVYKRTLVEKNPLERAQDAATVYMDIHKNRFELLSGYQEVNYSAQSVQLMNDELKKMEAAYLALFKGKRFVSEESYSYYIVPEGDKSNQIYPIFKFSKEKGALELSASQGSRVNLSLETNGIAEAFKNQITSDQSAGVFYRIPETVRVSIDYENINYEKNSFIVPQLGVVQSVNTSKTLFAIDEKSGMLKALEIK